MTKRTYTRRTQSQWQHHITEQKESGLNIAEYCKQHQIAASNFYAWRSKLHRTTSAQPNMPASSEPDWLPIQEPLSTAFSMDELKTSVTLTLPGGFTLTIRSQ